MVSTRIRPLLLVDLVHALSASSLLFLLLVSTAAGSKTKRRQIRNTEQYANICTSLTSASYPPIKSNDKRRHSVLSALIDASGLQNLLAIDGPRLRSACWILYDDPAKLTSSNKSRLLERYALVVLYHASQGAQWASSKNWLSGSGVGKWEGVTASRPSIFSLQRHVTRLELPFNALNGILPRELSLLRQLRVLDLKGNDLQGVLPAKALSELKRLEVMELSMNNILGRVPTEVGLLKSLKEANLYGNYLEGPIPRRVKDLSNLEYLDVSYTYMSGSVPAELGECRKLKEVYLNDASFTGKIPSSLCQLNLDELWADCLGPAPEVTCDCPTVCYRGLPDPKQVDMRKSNEARKKKESTTAGTKKRKQ